MKNLFTSIIISLVFIVSVSAGENAPQYPIKTINGKSYYEYTISAGEGLYSIARRFGIKQRDLHDANPDLTTDIKVGQKILIPTTELRETTSDSSTEKLPIHIVEPKQTLYGISRMYNIPIDTLLALNPQAINGIKVGDTLVLSRRNDVTPKVSQTTDTEEPKQQTVIRPATHTVKRKETLYSISKQYDIPIHEILENNPEIGNVLKANQIIIINPDAVADLAHNNTDVQPEKPATEPANQAQSPIETAAHPAVADTVAMADIVPAPHTQSVANNTELPDIYNISDTDTMLRIVYLLPFMADQTPIHKSMERFLDFYRGSIVALAEAKKIGISANVHTFDTRKNTDRLDSILTLPELAAADIIIGPAYSDQLSNVLEFGRRHNIATIIPFSAKIPDSLYYEKLVQFNPPHEYLFKRVAETVKTSEKTNQNYIIGRFASGDTKGDSFADAVIANFTATETAYTEIVISPQNIDSLVQAAGSVPTTLLLASSSPVDVNLILEKLSSYTVPTLRVWGFEEWEALTRKYHNTIYYSLFNTQEPAWYHQTYGNIFGEPVNTVGMRYDLLGYDLTTLALQGITINGDKTLQINTTPTTYIQSKPSLTIEESRLLNNHFYLFHCDGYSTEVINQ